MRDFFVLLLLLNFYLECVLEKQKNKNNTDLKKIKGVSFIELV